MKERLPYDEEDRQRPAEPPAPADHPAVLALQLQRTAGNQANNKTHKALKAGRKGTSMQLP